MKKQIWIAFSAGILVTAVIAFVFLLQSWRVSRERETAVKALTTQVEYLSRTVVDLRSELGVLRERERHAAAALAMPKALPAPTVESTAPPLGRVQPNGQVPAGQPFEFNGRTYYLTPLGNSSASPTVVAK